MPVYSFFSHSQRRRFAAFDRRFTMLPFMVNIVKRFVHHIFINQE